MKRQINTIGIYLGPSDYCVTVFAGAPVYLHGSTDDIRAFAREIIAAADHHDKARAADARRCQSDAEPRDTANDGPADWRAEAAAQQRQK